MKPLNYKYLLLFVLSVLSFASCVNLRYTDYGRPFDFLKAKNNYHKVSTTTVDTANVCTYSPKETSTDLSVLKNDITKEEEQDEINLGFETKELPTQIVKESVV